MATLLLCASLLACGGGNFGEREGSVDVLAEAGAEEKQEIEGAISSLADMLVHVEGVDSSSRSSLRAALAFMSASKMLSWPAIAKASSEQQPPAVVKATAASVTSKRVGDKVELSDFSVEAASQSASESDVKYIRVSSVPSDHDAFTANLDVFLSSHRWWVVETEPYFWQKTSDKKPLLLRRIPWQLGEDWLKWLTKLQFVSNEQCRSRTIALFTARNAWGSFQNPFSQAFRSAVSGGAIFEAYQKYVKELLQTQSK